MSGLKVSCRDEIGETSLALDLSVASESVVALVGPSGAGKSTVLRVIAGLRRPAHGRVTFGSAVWLDTEKGRDQPPEQRSCGLMFQEYALFPHLNAWRNVAFGLGGTKAERRERASEVLTRFGLGGKLDARADWLSGGERQRVALARALARGPDVLLLDEPLSALDSPTRGAARRELATELRRTSIPTIVVTHDFAEAAQLADEVHVMDRGSIVQTGTAAEVSARPASGFVADFTGAVVLHGTARRSNDGLTIVSLDGGGRLMSTEEATGRVVATLYPWEIQLEPPGEKGRSSALNRLRVSVESTTPVGSRVRVGLAAPQPLIAEVSSASLHRLDIRPGRELVARWKATATRLIPA
jgi:molybdate transport system ATP-binding protein